MNTPVGGGAQPGSPLAVKAHKPVWLLQESSVHASASSQTLAAPGTHAPWLQVSWVHASSSESHGAALLACVQPSVASQLSVVQPLPSSQFTAVPAAQLPPWHVSAVVQALPSLQALPLG